MTESSNVGMFILAGIQVLTIVGLIVKLAGRERRTIEPQPLTVRNDPDPADRFAPKTHDHSTYMERITHEDICKERAASVSHVIKHATLDKEALQRQLDNMSDVIRTSFQEQEKHNEERASLMHHRINGISEPLNKLIGRFDDHIANHRARGES